MQWPTRAGAQKKEFLVWMAARAGNRKDAERRKEEKERLLRHKTRRIGAVILQTSLCSCRNPPPSGVGNGMSTPWHIVPGSPTCDGVGLIWKEKHD